MSRRRKRLEQQIGAFMRIYQRKHVQGELNDRQYSRKLETQIKRMNAVELDRLLRGEPSDSDSSGDSSLQEAERS